MTTENTTIDEDKDDTPLPPPAALDINDIQAVVTIIDYAAEQGAFKGWETINKVAGVRSRLATFLQFVAKSQAAAQAAAEASIERASDPAAEDATDATDDEFVLAPGA